MLNRYWSGVFIVLVFFADFELVNGGWNTYSLNANLSMHFRVGSRSPVTFRTKLYVITVNNGF